MHLTFTLLLAFIFQLKSSFSVDINLLFTFFSILINFTSLLLFLIFSISYFFKFCLFNSFFSQSISFINSYELISKIFTFIFLIFIIDSFILLTFSFSSSIYLLITISHTFPSSFSLLFCIKILKTPFFSQIFI